MHECHECHEWGKCAPAACMPFPCVPGMWRHAGPCVAMRGRMHAVRFRMGLMVSSVVMK